jgi:sec-independent protein translocase protein TatA
MQNTTLFLSQIGFTEGLIILVIILILFGGKKIPSLAKDIGTGIREFKNSLTGTNEQISHHEPEEPEYKRNTPAKKKKQA